MTTATAPRRRSYSRSDVQMHSEMWREPHPAVNIKRHLWENGEGGDFPTSLLASVAKEAGHDADEFVTWWRTMADEDEAEFDQMLDAYVGFGCESGFEDARSDAEFIFDRYTTEVWQEGRSGGWLVVFGLPDVDEWDAVLLAKWRKFEKWVRSAVDAFPETVAMLVAINRYESHLDDLARAKRWQEVGRWEAKFTGTPLAGMVALDAA